MKLEDCIMILEGLGFLGLTMGACITNSDVQIYYFLGSTAEILVVAFIGWVLKNIKSIHEDSRVTPKLKIWSIISLPLGLFAIIIAGVFSVITQGKANSIAFILFLLGIFIISSFLGMVLRNGDKK